MATQTLYLRSTASKVCVTKSVHLLSLTQGTSAVIDCSDQVDASTTFSYQQIPGTTGNNTSITPASVVHSQGYLFDGQAPVSGYQAGTWTVQVVFAENQVYGSGAQALFTAYVFVVTSNGSMVTKVSEVGHATSAPYSISSIPTVYSLSFNASAVSLKPNQYLYVELYSSSNGQGTGKFGTNEVWTSNLYTDASGATVSAIITPNVSVAQYVTAADNFSATLSDSAFHPQTFHLTAGDTLGGITDAASKYRVLVRQALDNLLLPTDVADFTVPTPAVIFLYPIRVAGAWLAWYLSQPPDSLIAYLQQALYTFYANEEEQ